MTAFVIPAAAGAQDHAGGGVSTDLIGYNIAFAEAYDQTGKPLTEVNKKVTGSRMLNENWGTGTVTLKGGFVLKEVELQFDIFKNELHFRKNNIVYLFVDSVQAFTINYADNNDTTRIEFRSGFPPVEKNTGATFYRVVAGGPKLQLLQFISKEVREKIDYLSPTIKEYARKDNYYVYDAATNTMHLVMLRKKSVLNALPGYTAAINDFAAANNISFKSEADLVKLFTAINR